MNLNKHLLAGICVLSGLSAAAYGVTISGNVQLDGETDHSGIVVAAYDSFAAIPSLTAWGAAFLLVAVGALLFRSNRKAWGTVAATLGMFAVAGLAYAALVAQTLTDTAGDWSLDLNPGVYRIEFSKSGYGTTYVEPVAVYDDNATLTVAPLVAPPTATPTKTPTQTPTPAPTNTPTVPPVNGNLLFNPGAELSRNNWSIDTQFTPNWGAFSSVARTGNRAFISTYFPRRLYQNVELVALGFDTTYLDSAPYLKAESWYRGSGPNVADSYNLKVELRDAQQTPIATYDSGFLTCTGTYQEVETDFSGYGPGLRYIYMEHKGYDAEQVVGNLGAAVDDCFVGFAYTPTPSKTPTPSNTPTSTPTPTMTPWVGTLVDTDFATGVPAGVTLHGSATYDAVNEWVQLTDGIADQQGSLTITIPGGNVVVAWDVTFMVYMGGGTLAGEGVALNYATDDNWLGGDLEHGVGYGLHLGFNTFKSGTVDTANRSYVKYPDAGINVAAKTNQSTGTVRGSWRRVRAYVTNTKRLYIYIDKNADGDVLDSNELIRSNYNMSSWYSPQFGWSFNISSRTGARNDFHRIDDLVITTTL